MKKMILIFSVAILSFGCNNKDKESALFFEDGRAKPVAVIAPVLDSTSFDYPWSLSDEFTSYLINHIGDQKNINIISKDSPACTNNPFDPNLSWIKDNFAPAEFVVFIEFIEHKKVPDFKKGDDPNELKERSYNLVTSARIRIVDIRGVEAKIVLQEMVENSYFIPKNVLKPDYNVATFGTKAYSTSPLGLAHLQFAKMLEDRICDYILLAKSR